MRLDIVCPTGIPHIAAVDFSLMLPLGVSDELDTPASLVVRECRCLAVSRKMPQ